MAKNKVKNEGAFIKRTRKIINDNFRDVSDCTTQLDAVTGTTGATLTNIPGMVTDVMQPGKYEFEINLIGICTANGGMNIALKQGAGMVLGTLKAAAKVYTASALAVTSLTSATDQALLVDTSAVFVAAEIKGILTVTTAGTLALQMAQDDAHADTTSIYLGSYMKFVPIGATTPLLTAVV